MPAALFGKRIYSYLRAADADTSQLITKIIVWVNRNSMLYGRG